MKLLRDAPWTIAIRKLRRAGIPVFLFLIFAAFQQDDLIELDGMLNARTDAYFHKNKAGWKRENQNVRFTLTEGTRAKVLQVQKFEESGNSALLVEVLNGSHEREKVWIHYDPKKPWIKLYKKASDAKDQNPAGETTDVARAEAIRAQRAGQVVRDPASAAPGDPLQVSEAEELVRMLGQVQGQVSAMGAPHPDCMTESLAPSTKTVCTERAEVADPAQFIRMADPLYPQSSQVITNPDLVSFLAKTGAAPGPGRLNVILNDVHMFNAIGGYNQVESIVGKPEVDRFAKQLNSAIEAARDAALRSFGASGVEAMRQLLQKNNIAAGMAFTVPGVPGSDSAKVVAISGFCDSMDVNRIRPASIDVSAHCEGLPSATAVSVFDMKLDRARKGLLLRSVSSQVIRHDPSAKVRTCVEERSSMPTIYNPSGASSSVAPIPAAQGTSLGGVSKPEGVQRAPRFDRHHTRSINARRLARTSGSYDVYEDPETNLLEGFTLRARDPLNPRGNVSSDRFTREWRFLMEGDARQNIHLYVSDVDNEGRAGQIPMRSMYFFPRKQMPSIVEKDGVLHVTLPNGEKVQYDAATKKIIGGALSEQPIDTRPGGAPRATPQVSYRGAGVVLTATNRGKSPEFSQGSVTISKQGFRNCEVPSTDVFIQQPKDAFFRFETDEAFDAFIRKRCGFGI